MNANTAPLRVFTLADGRRVKEVTGALTCKGCMFVFQSNDRMQCGRDEEDGAVLFGCRDRSTIYQPADHKAVGYLWRHAGTGRTRLVDPDCVITTQPGGWEMVGPLVLGKPEAGKREPLTDEQIDRATAAEQDELLDLIFVYGLTSEVILERARKIARAIERAHGIGGREGGGV